MLQIQLVYTDNGKKYTFPQELLEKYVDAETFAKIKIGLLKEINKL